jgi:hypothetical protein
MKAAEFLRLHKHRWFSGRMLACHAGGPGSIPGRCTCFLSFNKILIFLKMRAHKKRMPQVRIELTTLRLWDLRAAYCATEAMHKGQNISLMNENTDPYKEKLNWQHFAVYIFLYIKISTLKLKPHSFEIRVYVLCQFFSVAFGSCPLLFSLAPLRLSKNFPLFANNNGMILPCDSSANGKVNRKSTPSRTLHEWNEKLAV